MQKKAQSKDASGFTLLELIVVISIISLTLTWALPQFRRRTEKSSVQTFTQALVSGFYSLRARQGTDGSGCDLKFSSNYNFNTSNTFGSAKDLFELNHLNAKERDERLKCCDSAQCWNKPGDLTWAKPYRFLNLEGIPSSKKVEMQVSRNTYELSPPGTSAIAEPLVILVRSQNWNQDPDRPLPTLCVEVSSNGVIRKGKWNSNKKQCKDT
ncbi:MAG: prepilin-type N-terminal cleavage/methylation domain-containing protein [Synechococcus sp. s2_metabat2_7]|nr:prepilin-type N-terminal cleavage/methylation domain-containing protein [Synechococcus sp. s2_metabat2_7]